MGPTRKDLEKASQHLVHIIQINKNVTPTITVQNRVTVYIVITIFESRGERGERRMIDDG